MMKFRLEGLTVAPFTPFKENGDLNLQLIDLYIGKLADDGVVNAFVCGTNGEGISMTSQERKEVAEAWLNYNKGRLKSIVVNVGSAGVGEAKELAAHAEKIGAHAIACLPPLFYRLKNKDDLAGYLKEVAAAAPKTPFYYYHIPCLTPPCGDMEDIFDSIQKKDIPSCCGAKFTSADTGEFSRLLRKFGDQYQFCFGNDESVLAALAVGCDAFVGGSYNHHGRVVKRVIDAFQRGDIKIAREEFGCLSSSLNVLRKHGGDVAANKYMMKICRMDLGPPRSPLQKWTNEQLEAMRKDLLEIGTLDWIN